MKIKKYLLGIIVAILCTFILAQNMSYAKSISPIYLGVTEIRTLSTPNIGYAIGDPKSNGSDPATARAAKIWNIVKYTTESSNDPTEGNYYCVKAGVGFSDTHKRATYNLAFDLKTEREEIAKHATVLEELVNGGYYNHLLAMVDLLYLPGVSTEEQKEALLTSAGIDKRAWDFSLTDDDIKAVQQAAIWYYTNYGEYPDEDEKGKYDKYNKTGWLNYTTNGTDYTSLSSYEASEAVNGRTNSGEQRQLQAEILYKYLIDTAKTNASKYENSTTAGIPVTVKKTTLTMEEQGENYIVGPMHITKNNDMPYELEFSIKDQNNSEISNYTLLDENKAEATDKTIKDLVGKDFYVRIQKDQVTSVKVTMNVKYSTTKATLYVSETNKQEQPVILVEKEDVEQPTTLTVGVEKQSDLALRKYITKINGTEIASSRIPVVDESTLKTGTTATYKHRKDPVVAENGDVITYNLTIYNEGEKAARASKIVDQLATGLKFKEIKTAGYTADYDEETNKLTITKTGTNNLNAYTEGNLSSETIEIECTVDISNLAQKHTLTNVAWISEFIDEDGTVITNQDGYDVDSKPSTTPDVNKDNISDYKGSTSNKEDQTDSTYFYKGQEDDDDFEKISVLPKEFDLKLIKYIAEVNSVKVPDRIQEVDTSNLNTEDQDGNTITTADYTVSKEPVGVKKGDLIKYTFRVYNEGDIDGYASEITEDIPEGLAFVWDEKTGEELQNDTTYTEEEKVAIEFNQSMFWTLGEDLKTISTDYLSKENSVDEENLIKAFDKEKQEISYKEVSVILKVISEDVTGTTIRNEAAITKDEDKDGNEVNDRDSSTEEWKKYEDDEDYDICKLQSFDLALRKFIVAVGTSEDIQESDYLKEEDGTYTRAPIVDTSMLNKEGEDGKIISTATYSQPKQPVSVQKGNTIVYMFRAYNEGDLDGYAAEITDNLPPYLEFVEGEFNENYGWTVSEDGRTVTTRYLENSLINKISTNEEGEIVLSYKEVPILCKIKDDAKAGEAITNIAEITEYQNEKKEPITDRDSQPGNVEIPTDEELPNYKDDEVGEYIPGQQDDDDFEKVKIQSFDLALRKFITAVDNKEITTRIPTVKYEDGKITYEHDKEPVEVAEGNIVTYTIRVYNEGETAGYAQEIEDDIPEGLEFLPENETNIANMWKMYDEEGNETTDVSKAVKVKTKILSKEVEDENEGVSNLLEAFDKNAEIVEGTNPSSKDVKIAFKVGNIENTDKIVINSAQITDDANSEGDPVDDIDSTPDEWNEGEDDQDQEKIKVQYFDLALKKFVSKTIVIEDGKETITQTGHTGDENPEPIVKIEIDRKKINKVTVKFGYTIKVTNEGDIPGYVKEITDYIPEGLKFNSEDNPNWTDEGNNVISTKQLEGTLLNPGESTTVEVILTWINGADNIGLKTNTAEISEDFNDKDVPDRDSTPDNKKEGEDDIDTAPVLLGIKTGGAKLYVGLGLTILITIAGGLVLIKKFVI